MKILHLSIYSLFFVGCANIPINSTNYSFLSTNKVDIPNIKVSGMVEGESCSVRNFKITATRDMNPTINKAIGEAIKDGKRKGFEGDFLVDTQITETNTDGYFYYKTCFKVEGKLAAIQKK